MNRRRFLTSLGAAGVAATLRPLRAAPSPVPRIGIDNFGVRAMQWQAPDLIRYAASLRCDTLFLSDLGAFESLDEAALRAVRQQADAAGIALYVGSWSICPSSTTFRPTWGTAEEHLRLTLRVAQVLGSPVARVILGNMEDRRTPGGIRARMADTLAVLRACRRDAERAGVKVAVENHAGDLHSWELRELIEDAGTDYVGANLDSGNAAWALEDPHEALETLGPVTVCSSLRDCMIWRVLGGAAVQWTAIGEGLIDWDRWMRRWQALCPHVPIMVETISGFARTLPYETPDFWQHYDRRPESLARFEALAARGRALLPYQEPTASEERAAAQEAFQRGEIERSVRYLREHLRLGQRA